MEQYQFSLVFFTTLTQWAIGTIAAITLYRSLAGDQQQLSSRNIILAIWGVFMIGSSSSLAHLGSPLEAYNALRGLGHSWLSREVVAFGLLNGLVALWALSHLVPVKAPVQQLLGMAASVAGLITIVMSAQIYFVVEHQPEWHTPLTHLAFLGTALLLGLATLMALLSISRQNVPALFRVLLGAALLYVFAVIIMVVQITGLTHVGMLLWFRIFASVMVGVALLVMVGDRNKRLTPLMVLAMLMMVSGEIAGRMAFFSSVMAKTPW